ncbi:MAG TPA: carboxymuconolactone decarboxylase family protein [Candidatus Melainabacteria bacterium]|nr:carboxymuconolactone decarboxylase family protein [Candidatus Melainabacteria bacterium]
MPSPYTHPRRLPRPNRENLSEREKKIFDVIDQTRGGVWGPYSALMHVPDLAGRVASVGEYLRFQGILDGSLRELAILATAKACRSAFEWTVHEPIARKEGSSKEAIEFLRTGIQANLNPDEDLVIECIKTLCAEKTIPQPLYDKLEERFSKEEIIELVTIAGFYQMLAFVIAGFDVPDPDENLEHEP